MSIAEQAARITALRDELRNILLEMGLVDEQDKLQQCVEALKNMAKVPVEDTVLDTENAEMAITEGYHRSGGRVRIIPEEKNVTENGIVIPSDGKVLSKVTVNVEKQLNLQEKTAVPSKEIKTIVPDEGFDGLSKVIIEAIADIYADVSAVNAVAEDVLEGKTIVSSTGEKVAGTMKNMAASEISIDGLVNEETAIPAGFYNGLGHARITSSVENALSLL